MKFLYNFNGLPIYTAKDIAMRNHFTSELAREIQDILHTENQSWKLHQIEAPCLILSDMVSDNYSADDVFVVDSQLTLKPETTASSYMYAEHLFEHQLAKPPLVVWQASKSFRKEMDQSTKHCRFKEFYQLEFQCIYNIETKNDYQASIIDKLATVVRQLVKLPTRIVVSDRLPSYSLKTLDIEVNNGDKWMEVCSVSVRTDFKYKPKIGTKSVSCLVLEIALGLDRLVYNAQLNYEVLT